MVIQSSPFHFQCPPEHKLASPACEMLPSVLPHPPHLQIPKYIPVYNTSVQLVSRPRLGSAPSSFFTEISHLVASRESPAQSDSPTDTVDDDHLPSPQSPGNSGNYHYVNSGSGSFDSPISSTDMYDSVTDTTAYPNSSQAYQSGSATQENYNQHGAGSLGTSDNMASYLSDSPSPVEGHPTPSFPQSLSAPHTQERFTQSYNSEPRFNLPTESLTQRYARNTVADSNPNLPSLLDHRRMSEPAVLGSTNQYASTHADPTTTSRYQQFSFGLNHTSRAPPSRHTSSLHQRASIDSLHNLRQQHYDYSSPHSPQGNWKQEDDLRHHRTYADNSGAGDEPLSPFQPNFSGGVINSPTGGLQYSPIAENMYGPSPPGTGTSTSSHIARRHSVQHISQAERDDNLGDGSADLANSKTYSFVALPGNAVKKRPRRRYDEIERLYQCSWPDCSKAYGTLNHLNAHVTMQKHGSKRSPNGMKATPVDHPPTANQNALSEFKELRKQWRKAKKDSESPVSGPLRRGSMGNIGLRHDERDIYDHRMGPLLGQPMRHRPHIHHLQGLGLPSSVSIPHGDIRYPIPLEEIRYPADNYGMTARQRYSGSAPSSWHPSHPTSRSLPHQYMSSGSPSMSHAHHTHLPQLNIQSHHSQTHPHSPQPVVMDRLPPDSTLLTPLPGYQPPSLLPPLEGAGDLSYPQEYSIYEDSQRPGTGHGSLGRSSSGEYDPRS